MYSQELNNSDAETGLVNSDHTYYKKSNWQKTAKRVFLWIALIIIVGLVAVIIVLTLRGGPTDNSNRPASTDDCINPSVTGKKGMVSTTNSMATDIGLSILQSGGNAFDAAIAIQWALAVVQPQSTGIGGGCFVVFYSALNRTVHALDAREEAPEAFSPNAFCQQADCSTGAWNFTDAVTGGHPVGVPGVVAAMDRLYKEWGSGSARTGEVGKRVPWADLFAPAISLAANGFPMYTSMYQRLLMNQDRMMLFPETAKLFFPNGKAVEPGYTWKNPDIAQTLSLLAQGGRDVYYNGTLTTEIVNAARNAKNPTTGLSGVMTEDDIHGYRAVYREPAKTTYRGYPFYNMGSPSSGGMTMAMILNFLENYSMDELTHNQAEYLHKFIDAQDMAFADRNMYMGDTDFVDPLPPYASLLNKSYALSRVLELTNPVRAARAAFNNNIITAGDPYNYIDPTINFKESFAQSPHNPKKGTTHLVVADQYGNWVSMTTTIEENFGSGVTVPGRGFLLNNELTDFTALPSDPITKKPYANAPAGGKRIRRSALGADSLTYGGKRPMSSMSPTIVMNKALAAKGIEKPWLALGSPGGSDIIGTVSNVLIGILDSGLCIGDAVASPRAISKNLGFTQVEWPLYNYTEYAQSMNVLRNRGFRVEILITARPLGYVQVVKKTPTGFEGVADSTRLPEATAKGY